MTFNRLWLLLLPLSSCCPCFCVCLLCLVSNQMTCKCVKGLKLTNPSPSSSLSACTDTLPAPLGSLPPPCLSCAPLSVFCGYVAAPATHQRGKRKKCDLPSVPPPAKASFRSTECLLLSLIRQGTCDETESPMTEVLGGKLKSRLASLRGGDGQLGGSCISLNTAAPARRQTRSCSLETILDDSAPLTRQQLFMSNESLASCSYSNRSRDDSHSSKTTSVTLEDAPVGTSRNRLSVVSMSGLSAVQRMHALRPRSVGSCLDIVMETKEEDVKEQKLQGRASSCLNVNTPADQPHSSSSSASSASRPPSLSSCHPSFSSRPLSSLSSTATAEAHGSHTTTGPRAATSTSNLWTLPAPAVVRRCLSSVDVSKPARPVSLFKAPVCASSSSSSSSSQPPQPKPEHSKTLSPPLPVCLLVCPCLTTLTPSNI